ncbi:MAG: cation:proton antiporter [Pseudomonadota bacterium]
MDEQLPLLLLIAILTLAAISAGLTMVWLKQPPLVGYIMAGVILGPAVTGFMPQIDHVPMVAEFGVLFLLFVIGMEISLKAFLADLRPAVLTVLGQLFVALIAMIAFGAMLDWPAEQIVLLTFVVTMSSTAVALKVLDDIGELRTDLGRLVVAVMIAQDIAIAPMLIIANAFGGGDPFDVQTLVTITLAIGGLIAFIVILGPRGKLHFPMQDHILGRVELVTLAALLVCCTVAVLSGVAGMSPFYGAFLAGLIIGKTTLRSEAIHAMEPIQGVLMVMFFVAIGLLLDVQFIRDNLMIVSIFVIGALLLKSISNIVILRMVGLPWPKAYEAGLIMGQIGEFSFVLAAVGLANQVLDPVGYKLAISVIVLSLLFSPLWMIAVKRIHAATGAGIQGLVASLAYVPGQDDDDLVTHPVMKRARSAMTRLAARDGGNGTSKPRGAGEKPPSAAE